MYSKRSQDQKRYSKSTDKALWNARKRCYNSMLHPLDGSTWNDKQARMNLIKAEIAKREARLERNA